MVSGSDARSQILYGMKPGQPGEPQRPCPQWQLSGGMVGCCRRGVLVIHSSLLACALLQVPEAWATRAHGPGGPTWVSGASGCPANLRS